MNIEDLFDREAFIAGVARGFKEFLEQSEAAKHFGDLVETLGTIHLAKEGVLDADQSARLLGIARRTFDRKVHENVYPKSEVLGYLEPRWLVKDLVEKIIESRDEARRKNAAQDGNGALTVVDLVGASAATGRRRRSKAA